MSKDKLQEGPETANFMPDPGLTAADHSNCEWYIL